MTKKILLVLSSILIACCVAEGFLRLFRPQVVFSSITPTFSFPCYDNSSYSWVRLKKNANCLLSSNISNDFKEIVVRTNNLGMRGKSIKKEKSPGSKMLLFLGDSFTMGWGVKELDSFPEKTGKILTKSSPHTMWEVLNAGIPTTGVDDYYLYFKNEGLALDPDYLIVGFFPYNDIITYTTWTAVDKNGLPEKIESSLYFVNNAGKLDDKRLPLKLKIPILRNSHLFSFLMDRLPLPIAPQTDYSFSEENTGNELCLYKRFCHEQDKEKEKTKKLFLALKKLANKGERKMLVVFIPANFQVDDYAANPFPLPLLHSDKRALHEEFGSFFKKHGIAYLDLLPVMHKAQNIHLYFPHDPHWNKNGHALAAKAIAEKLQEDLE